MGAMDTIKHVVVLMLENRSFDHMLGYLKNPPVDGLKGGETVPYNPENPAAGTAPVFRLKSPEGYRTKPDPLHEFDDVTLQIFGQRNPPSDAPPRNNGFVVSYSHCLGDDGKPVGPVVGQNILGCFTPDELPVMKKLAEEFVVCDRWFSSVPGPTWPNRDYVHAGTSMGRATSPSAWEMFWGYSGVRTIYQNLAEQQKTWKIYIHDMSQAFAFNDLRPYMQTNSDYFEAFEKDVKAGTLPNYSFIEPRYYNDDLAQGANDQHPPHDVRNGERLIASVYDLLRGNEGLWRESLFILVYDEHGGFYDHVLPPDSAHTPLVVNPDGKNSDDPAFQFDRFGLRVPAFLVSPWVPKCQVDHAMYDHTSIPAFLKKLFNLPSFLHRRDALANTFEPIFLDAARQETPSNLTVLAPVAMPAEIDEEAQKAPERSLSEYQKLLVALADSLRHPTTQRDAAQFVRGSVAQLRGSAAAPGAAPDSASGGRR